MTQSTTGGALYWEAGIDPAKLYEEIAKINGKLREMADTTAKSGQKMDDTFKSIGGMMAGYFSVQALVGFGQQMIKVRGEFQQLSIALETMLGSKVKADAMMSQMVEFAAKTPFTLQDVAGNAKQLMAMGVSSDKVIGTLKSLGDVAAGVSVPLQRVAVNYGQVLTMGKLQGRELKDFAMAGIPLLEELSKNLGKTKNEVSDMVSAGAIDFKEVEKAFQTMAGEGGKFANLMEKQNASVTGQISNLQDKIAVMFNEIGKSNEGIIYDGISAASKLISHYQDILNVVKVVAVTYGTYRAALIATVAIEKVAAASKMVQQFINIARAGRLATLATVAFNGALLANPITIAIVALAGLTAAFMVYSDKARTSEEVTDSLNKSIAGFNNSTKEIDNLMSTYDKLSGITNRTVEQNKQLTDVMNAINQSVAGAATEFDKYGNVLGINVEKVKLMTKTIREAKKLTLETDVKAKEEEAKKIEAQIAEEVKKLETKKIAAVVFKGGYERNTTRDLTDKELQETSRRTAELTDQYQKVQQEVTNGKNALNSLVETKAIETGKHVVTVSEKIKEIDKDIASIQGERDKLDATDTKKFAKYTQQIDALEAQKRKYEGKGEADDKKADKALEDKNKATEELNKRHLANLEEFANFEAGITAGKVAKMEEGLEKEKIQNQLAYETREKEINREKEQTIKLLNEQKGVKAGSAPVVTELTGDAKLDYDKKIANALELRRIADEKSEKDWAERVKNIWDEVYASTLTGYEKEVAANQAKYDQMAKDAKKANDPKLIAAVEKERAKAREAIDREHNLQLIDYQEQVEGKKNALKAQGYDREARMDQLNFETWLKYQKARLAILKASNDAQDQQNAVLLEAEINAATSDNNLKNENRIRNQIVSSAEALVGVAGQYNSKLGDSLGSLLGIGKILDTVISKGKNMTQEEATASIVSGISGMIGMMAGASAERKRVADEYYKSAISQQLQYNLLLNDQLRLNSDINGTMFIKDYKGALNDSTKAYNDAQKNMSEGMKALEKQKAVIGQKNAVDGNAVLKGAASGAAIGAGVGSIVPVIGTAIGAAVGGIAGALTGIFAGKKKVDILGDLVTTYPKLIKISEDGTKSLNKELAKTLMDSKQITDETKNVLKQIEEWEGKAEAARAQIKQVIQDLSGSLGDDMRNALVSAFKEGTDSAVAFGGEVNKVLENIMTNMLFNKVFEGAFSQLEKGMTASYQDAGDQTWLDDFKTFLDQKQTLTAQFNTEMENAKQAAKSYGFDIFQKSTEAAAAAPKSLAGSIGRDITEATGSELAGLARKISDDTRINRDYNKQAVNHLALIEANTFRTANNTDRLENIETGIAEISKNTRQTLSSRDLGG